MLLVLSHLAQDETLQMVMFPHLAHDGSLKTVVLSHPAHDGSLKTVAFPHFAHDGSLKTVVFPKSFLMWVVLSHLQHEVSYDYDRKMSHKRAQSGDFINPTWHQNFDSAYREPKKFANPKSEHLISLF